MSLENVGRVDATGVRDGWAVVTIYQFEPWSSLEEPVELLRRKIDTCLDHIRSVRFQMAAHRLPVRIELVTRDAPDDEISALCALWGVDVVAGSPSPAED